MTRKTALVLLRVAGYHNDTKAFVRLYVENRVSIAAADREWERGKQMQAAGVPCTCRDCTRRDET